MIYIHPLVKSPELLEYPWEETTDPLGAIPVFLLNELKILQDKGDRVSIAIARGIEQFLETALDQLVDGVGIHAFTADDGRILLTVGATRTMLLLDRSSASVLRGRMAGRPDRLADRMEMTHRILREEVFGTFAERIA